MRICTYARIENYVRIENSRLRLKSLHIKTLGVVGRCPNGIGGIPSVRPYVCMYTA